MTQPQNISQKIEDKLTSVFNRGGGSKNAANRESAESQISEAKSSVKAATTENISSLNGLLTIDGVSLSAGDRVLVKNQTTQSQNGIYIVSSGDWQRSNDANSNSKVRSGMNVFVRQGTENADSGWFLSTDGNIDLGTTSLFFKKITDNIDTEILEGVGIDLSYDSMNDTLTISSNVDSQISTEIIEGSGINILYDSVLDTLTFRLKLENKTPSSSSDSGSVGEVCYDSSYLYVCVAQNSWKRISLGNW